MVTATLTQLHAREEKHMGFLHFYLRTDITLLVLKHHRLTLGWSWEKNYVKMCPFLPISKILKTFAATLTQLHAREEKHMGFLHFCLRLYITLLV